MFDDLTTVWLAFWDLHSARRVGFDLLPLTITDVAALFTIHDFGLQERIEFKDYILAMDRAYLKHYVGRKTKEGLKNGGNVQRSNKRASR